MASRMRECKGNTFTRYSSARLICGIKVVQWIVWKVSGGGDLRDMKAKTISEIREPLHIVVQNFFNSLINVSTFQPPYGNLQVEHVIYP
jgi:hypothetical protein